MVRTLPITLRRVAVICVKGGIPFVERLPSDPLFREHVRPTSGTHRVPQLLTPEGDVVQDTVAMQDYLKAGFQTYQQSPVRQNSAYSYTLWNCWLVRD